MARKDLDRFLEKEGLVANPAQPRPRALLKDLVTDPARLEQITKAHRRLTESMPHLRVLLKEVARILSTASRQPSVDQMIGSIHAMLNGTDLANLVTVILSPTDINPDDPSIDELVVMGEYGFVIDSGISEKDTPYIDVMVGRLRTKNR